MKRLFLVIAYNFLSSLFALNTLFCQQFFASGTNLSSYSVLLDDSPCTCDVMFLCSYQGFGPGGGFTYSPEGIYYSGNVFRIDSYDPLTCMSLPIFTYSGPFWNWTGLVSIGGGIFYTTDDDLWGTAVYEIDINNASITNLGSTGYPALSDLCMYNSEIYYLTNNGIVHLNISNPSNSVFIPLAISGFIGEGLTASPWCNTLISLQPLSGPNYQLLTINILDGSVNILCQVPEWFNLLAGQLEYANPAPCNIMFSLNCDESGNVSQYDCLTLNGVPITDQDINIISDDFVQQMTVTIASPVPDAPNEILIMIGSVPNITVSGSGTSMITLMSSGAASIQNFRDALKLIVYKDLAFPLTPGIRTIQAQFTSAVGTMSPIAEYHVEVVGHSLIPVDLGDDIQLCSGQSATLDAGNSGSTYMWNTGQTSQTITVGSSGQYIVTVSNNTQCPNQDTVELDIIPVIYVALTGDTEICDNEHANMTIETDTPFPLTIEITPNPGTPFTLSGITGNYNFFDLISTATEYTITDVTSSQPACIEITDSTQLINVNPTYIHDVDTSLCAGDSIWFGYYWETDAGYYPILFNSQYGCDSTVNFTLHILPAVNVSVQSTTCDPAGVGVFVTHLNNPTGCDTIVHTTVSLLPSDTTLISQTSCNFSSTGVFTQFLTNQNGCDSLVITSISLIPPFDTTMIFQETCDSSLLGVNQQLLLDQTGCDSLVITTVTLMPADTNYLFSTSCDSSSLGVFEMHFNSQSGCDSAVFVTVTYELSDSTYLSGTSCDSSSLGVFETHFNSQAGCDSVVFTTVTYSTSDFTDISTTSCDPAQAGVFIDTLINRFGCDSIVTQMVTLLPSEQTNISSTTCDPSLAGVFIHTLTNQYGCDSIVTETIGLLPSDVTSLSSTICMSSQAGVFVTNLVNQYGCDSTVTLTVTLVPADTTILSFKTCDPNQVGSIQNTFTNIDGCDSLVIEQTDLLTLPELSVEVSSDFNGFDISCFGESDGSAIAKVSGVSPFSYIWSTGDTGQSISGLSAGIYTVTITDNDGCKTNGEVTLLDPGPFSITFLISQPDCFDQQNGNITVNQTGGVIPIRYSIDGVNFQPSPTFNSLDGGTYNVTALDANECEVKEIIWINVPLAVNVDLGDDRIIQPGDTTIIQAIVNVPYDSLKSIVWTGLSNPNCPMCLAQPVAPIITTSYSVSVTSIDDCADSDTLILYLKGSFDVYVPNIFSPNGDNINDRLVINTGLDVQEISSFVVYDRWGNMVFSADHFQSNDLNNSWDGTLKGKMLNSAVFAYKMIVVFKDGRQQMRYGDVTLVK